MNSSGVKGTRLVLAKQVICRFVVLILTLQPFQNLHCSQRLPVRKVMSVRVIVFLIVKKRNEVIRYFLEVVFQVEDDFKSLPVDDPDLFRVEPEELVHQLLDRLLLGVQYVLRNTVLNIVAILGCKCFPYNEFIS